MSPSHSKSALLYGQVRRALQSGHYTPGQRIDPSLLAMEFSTSLTPVRFALYRLVGEGLINDHARHGFQVPLPTEMGMRDLYDWMERLLSFSLQRLDAEASSQQPQASVSNHDDLPKQTWKLFDAIARSTGKESLHQAVRRTNDRLAPIRRAKQALIKHADEELAELTQLWRTHDIPRLGEALHAYHQRREQLVPRIVALLAERSRRQH